MGLHIPENMMWYVLRPPHTACFFNENLDEPNWRICSHLLDRRVMSKFPGEGIQIELPVARFDHVYRTITVDKNTLGGLMMAIYLFYWSPIGSLAAMEDVPDDCSGYRTGVEKDFSRGAQPKWGDLIGQDVTHDLDDQFIPQARRNLVQASEGYCHGMTHFARFRKMQGNVWRLECNS